MRAALLFEPFADLTKQHQRDEQQQRARTKPDHLRGLRRDPAPHEEHDEGQQPAPTAKQTISQPQRGPGHEDEEHDPGGNGGKDHRRQQPVVCIGQRYSRHGRSP